MGTDFSALSWQESFRSYLLHLKAVRAEKTVRYYHIQLKMLSRWAEETGIPLDKFGKRHLDAYLVHRLETGKSQTTLHHDALAAKVFLKWRQRNDVIKRSLLAGYEVRNAPRPANYMPTPEDMQKLLAAVSAFCDPSQNTDARYLSPPSDHSTAPGTTPLSWYS